MKYQNISNILVMNIGTELQNYTYKRYTAPANVQTLQVITRLQTWITMCLTLATKDYLSSSVASLRLPAFFMPYFLITSRALHQIVVLA